jgi:phosphoglycerate dehydrogenase-like enzyme
MTQVLVSAPFPANLMEKLRSVSADLVIEQIDLPKSGWPDDKTTMAEVYYAAGTLPPLELAPNLKWIQAHWAGVDHLHQTPIWDSDVQITTTSGIHTSNVGQYVIAMMLAWTNRVPRWLDFQGRGEWPKRRWDIFRPDELRGQTMGILGYGSLGREIARLAKGFGMKVLATKRDARKIIDEGYRLPGTGDPLAEMVDRIYPSEATRSMLVNCDYVIITLPHTPKTHHLFDEQLLKALKPNCFLINVGRGSIIDEKALVKALKKEWIAGAGLDVFETEPLPSDSPLWSLDNLIISPHVSGFTPHYNDRATDLFAENLRRYLAGDSLLNLVDREAGY